jgi:hypothetical protein
MRRRKAGTADTFVVGDRVTKVEGIKNLGRSGIVTRVFDVRVGGDTIVQIDGSWEAYDRQLEKVTS